MSRTPAAHLARLKVTYLRWHITRDGPKFQACPRQGPGPLLIAATIDELESLLIAEEIRR